MPKTVVDRAVISRWLAGRNTKGTAVWRWHGVLSEEDSGGGDLSELPLLGEPEIPVRIRRGTRKSQGSQYRELGAVTSRILKLGISFFGYLSGLR